MQTGRTLPCPSREMHHVYGSEGLACGGIDLELCIIASQHSQPNICRHGARAFPVDFGNSKFRRNMPYALLVATLPGQSPPWVIDATNPQRS